MISSQILDKVETSDSVTLEISKTGASVIQLDDYRIAITHPPFQNHLKSLLFIQLSRCL